MKQYFALFIACACSGALLIGVAGCGSKPETAKQETKSVVAGVSGGWTVPVDVSNLPTPSEADYINFAWQSFVAINWPALPATSSDMAQPNTTQTPGAKAANGAVIPTVWELYRDLATTMLAGATDPGAWPSGMTPPPSGCTVPVPSGAVAPNFQPIILNMVSKFSNFPSETEQATNNPLVDQAGWYVTFDVRMDQSEYTYIRQFQYYNAANQIAAYAPPNTGIQKIPRNGTETYFNPSLPAYAQYGALEVKAAWRVLDPAKDIFSRYYTQVGYFLQPDGVTCSGPNTFGLIGLHVLRLTPSMPGTWFWSTFEQVDNVAVPSGVQRPDGTPLTPTLAQPNTPNGQCTSAYNVAPPSVKGNIPWDNKNAPVNVCAVTYPPPAAVVQANQAWQAKLQGTPFAYYQLDNTIHPMISGSTGYTFPPLNDTSNQVETNTMANTSMETYFQEPGQSCLSCHGYGEAIGGPNPTTSSAQIFTFLLSNADTATTAAAAAKKKHLILLPLDKFPNHRVMTTAPKRRP